VSPFTKINKSINNLQLRSALPRSRRRVAALGSEATTAVQKKFDELLKNIEDYIDERLHKAME
jgi:hypothetical protein